MHKSSNSTQWFRYLETPIQKNAPVRLDTILEQRLIAFLKARKVQPFDSSEC